MDIKNSHKQTVLFYHEQKLVDDFNYPILSFLSKKKKSAVKHSSMAPYTYFLKYVFIYIFFYMYYFYGNLYTPRVLPI